MVAVFVFILGLSLASCQDYVVDVQRHHVEDELHANLFVNYNKHIVPYPNSSSPVLIEFSPPIISISDLDASTQTLTAEIFLKLVWNDSRLMWNPDHYFGIKVFQLPGYQLWQPPIKLLNSAKYTEHNEKSETLVSVHYNGKVVWNYPTTKSSHCEINLKYFPYDVHKCMFKFGSWTHDGLQIDVDLHPSAAENPFYDGFNIAGEWEILLCEAKRTSNVYDCCDAHWPDISFYVTLGRRSAFYKVAFVSPLSAIVSLLLISFWISPLKSERLMANFIVLVMPLLVNLYLSYKLPPVGNSVPLIMILSSVLLLLSTIATVATLVMSNFAKTKPHPVILRWAQSRPLKVVTGCLCISRPSSLEPSVGQDNHMMLMGNEVPKNSQLATFWAEEFWTPLFQIIDRLSFLLCTIILVSIAVYITS